MSSPAEDVEPRRPPLRLLEARLGHDRAALIIAKAGGRRLFVPAQLRDNERAVSALRKFVGRELALALIIHFGGAAIYVPSNGAAGGCRRVKLETVVRMTLEGKSAKTIARRLRCSDRTVHARRAEARAAGMLPAR